MRKAVQSVFHVLKAQDFFITLTERRNILNQWKSAQTIDLVFKGCNSSCFQQRETCAALYILDKWKVTWQEFCLTRSCSFLESFISWSARWRINLKVLQSAGLLAGRAVEWTISSANKSRQRRLGVESSITGNKTKKSQYVFFIPPPFSAYMKLLWPVT